MKTRLIYRWIFPIIGLLLLALSACGLTGTRLSASPPDPLVMQPEEVVESFYNWMLQYPGNPVVDGAIEDSPYVAPVFIERLERTRASFQGGPGYDPVLCAQDLPSKILVAPAVVSEDTAQIVVTTDFPDHTIELNLQRQEGEWKILSTHCMVP